MVSMHAEYVGSKACRLTHDDSGNQIGTDAPKDIGGNGAAFSPTDLVAAALSSCILTTIAMYAERHEIDFIGARAHVTKEMSSDAPRRIARLPVTITMPSAKIPAEMRDNLEKIGHTCPVCQSLRSDIEVPVTFVYE